MKSILFPYIKEINKKKKVPPATFSKVGFLQPLGGDSISSASLSHMEMPLEYFVKCSKPLLLTSFVSGLAIPGMLSMSGPIPI